MTSTFERRDFLVEIQGITKAFTAAGCASAPVQWSQTLEEWVAMVPPMATMAVEPFSGNFDNGGMGLLVIKGPELLLDRKTDGNETYLTAALAKGATTATVNSTTGFASSGTIWINREAITYSGTTATTFTGLTRGALGTFDVSHVATMPPTDFPTPVYDYNKTIHGRKVWIQSFDPENVTATKVTIFVGYVEDVSFEEDGYHISLMSVAQVLEQPSVGTGMKAAGRLRGVVSRRKVRGGRVIRDPHGELPRELDGAELIIELADYTNPFPYNESGSAGILTPVNSGSNITHGGLKLGDEYITYKQSAYPGLEGTVAATGSGTYGPYIYIDILQFPAQVGDLIQFTDSATSKVILTTITNIDQSNYYHAAHGMAPASLASVTFPGIQRVHDIQRAQAGSSRDDHEAGDDIGQVWVGTNDHVDRTLQLLNSGNESSGTYDVLPDWLGAGFPAEEIDVDSFRSLRLYSVLNTLVIEEPVTPKQLLTDLAFMTGGRIFVANNGKITARRDFAVWPDTQTVYSISQDNITRIPTWAAPISNVYNQWSFQSNGRTTLTFELTESKFLYGARRLQQPPKELVMEGASFGTLEAIAVGTLIRYSIPLPILTVEIAEQDTVILEPGQLVLVTLPNLPDQAGDEGITNQYFEVIEFLPNGETVQIQLMRLPYVDRVGLVAPAGIIESTPSTDQIKLEAASVSYCAPTTARNDALSAILGSGRDGTEDIDWFLNGDSLELIDESTLGSGTPTLASVVVDSIDYPNRTITLTAARPGWVAAGDYVRLDDYLTVKSNVTVSDLRITYFCWWADNTPVLSGGDSPFKWGP